MDEWIEFYTPFFPDRAKAEGWVARCEALVPPNNCARTMMHQAQRLISIADDLPKIRRTAESLQLMFFITCAEHLSKLHVGFNGEGQSRRYVRRFFENFVTGADRETLEIAFDDENDYHMRPLTFKRAVDLLYQIRCDVVHEGNYWGFAFHDGSTPMLNTNPDVTSNITIQQLRAIVVRGCINAVTARINAT